MACSISSELTSAHLADKTQVDAGTFALRSAEGVFCATRTSLPGNADGLPAKAADLLDDAGIDTGIEHFFDDARWTARRSRAGR